MKIGIISYNLPHKKTQDLLDGLVKMSYEITLLILPFKKYKEREVLFRHRPNMFQGKSPEVLSAEHNIDVHDFSISNCRILESQDYILIGGAGLISDDLILENKIINCHSGLTPLVRGLDSFKWAILNNLPVGNSLHFIDHTVDDGPIIYQEQLEILDNDTLESFSLKLYEREIEMLINFEEHIAHPRNLGLESNNPTMRMPLEKEKLLASRFQAYKQIWTKSKI